MKTNHISRQGWLWGMAALIIASFVFAMTDDSPAQTTKAKKKEADASEEEGRQAGTPARRVPEAR